MKFDEDTVALLWFNEHKDNKRFPSINKCWFKQGLVLLSL